MRKNFSISYCIGIYNEEKIVLKSIKTLKDSLNKLLGKDNYEVILVDNGSTDNTWNILKKNNFKNFKYIKIAEKGHGIALREAILHAKNEYIAITAIDLPFGFDDLNRFLDIYSKYDLVFGSKAHKDSQIKRNIKRKIASHVYKYLLKILFSLKISDTQGSLFFKKNKIVPLIKNCDANNAFFTTQIALNANKKGLKMYEIPVKMRPSKRKSKYNVLKDGFKMLKSMLKEFIRIHLIFK